MVSVYVANVRWTIVTTGNISNDGFIIILLLNEALKMCKKNGTFQVVLPIPKTTIQPANITFHSKFRSIFNFWEKTKSIKEIHYPFVCLFFSFRVPVKKNAKKNVINECNKRKLLMSMWRWWWCQWYQMYIAPVRTSIYLVKMEKWLVQFCNRRQSIKLRLLVIDFIEAIALRFGRCCRKQILTLHRNHTHTLC